MQNAQETCCNVLVFRFVPKFFRFRFNVKQQESVCGVCVCVSVIPHKIYPRARAGPKDVDTEVEKFVKANTQELAKDKWLCPLSGKKFKVGGNALRRLLVCRGTAHQTAVSLFHQETLARTPLPQACDRSNFVAISSVGEVGHHLHPPVIAELLAFSCIRLADSQQLGLQRRSILWNVRRNCAARWRTFELTETRSDVSWPLSDPG